MLAVSARPAQIAGNLVLWDRIIDVYRAALGNLIPAKQRGYDYSPHKRKPIAISSRFYFTTKEGLTSMHRYANM